MLGQYLQGMNGLCSGSLVSCDRGSVASPPKRQRILFPKAMTPTTKELLIQWLSRGNPQHCELLRQCTINAGSDGVLTIDCPRSAWDKLLTYSQELGWLASGRLITEVSLSLEGTPEHRFKPEHSQAYPSSTAPVDVFGLQLSSRLQLGSGNAIAVVEMHTNLGVFCTRKINEISQIPDERWRDNDMKAYHIPEEYERFMTALATHEQIADFEFHALTGNGQKYWQRVNAYLGKVGDRSVRVVEVADYKLL